MNYEILMGVFEIGFYFQRFFLVGKVKDNDDNRNFGHHVGDLTIVVAVISQVMEVKPHGYIHEYPQPHPQGTIFSDTPFCGMPWCSQFLIQCLVYHYPTGQPKIILAPLFIKSNVVLASLTIYTPSYIYIYIYWYH